MNTLSLYDRLGGETVLRKFVIDLYDYMDNTSEVKHIREMHSANLSHASEKLFMFLSGMFGGPALYMEKFGPPRLRRRHLSFSIGDSERDQWLMCAKHASNQLNIDNDVRNELNDTLTSMANHLRNQTQANNLLSKNMNT